MDIGYIDKEIGMKWIQEADEIGKMLAGLIKILEKKPNKLKAMIESSFSYLASGSLPNLEK